MGTLISIDRDLCENEQVCEAVCPVTVFRIHEGFVEVIHPEECTVCFKCAEDCPNGAIILDY